MKIALIGFGKMGQMLHELAPKMNCEVVSIIDSSHESATSTVISELSLKDADLCIDFTAPSSLIGNLQQMALLKKNIVIGTTGWYDSIELVKTIADEHAVGILYASNFSMGVQLFSQIVKAAATLMNAFEEYDLGLIEKHHRRKKDAPSGTAIDLAKILMENTGKETLISSVRLGNIIGEHQLIIDSEVDQISLTHRAKNRKGFALGALKAAHWLQGRKGLYSIKDMFQDLIKGALIS